MRNLFVFFIAASKISSTITTVFLIVGERGPKICHRIFFFEISLLLQLESLKGTSPLHYWTWNTLGLIFLQLRKPFGISLQAFLSNDKKKKKKKKKTVEQITPGSDQFK